MKPDLGNIVRVDTHDLLDDDSDFEIDSFLVDPTMQGEIVAPVLVTRARKMKNVILSIGCFAVAVIVIFGFISGVTTLIELLHGR